MLMIDVHGFFDALVVDCSADGFTARVPAGWSTGDNRCKSATGELVRSVAGRGAAGFRSAAM